MFFLRQPKTCAEFGCETISAVEKSFPDFLHDILEKYDARGSTSVAALACGNRMAAPCSLEGSEYC